ncbi:hypothetical protein FB567DRAFT_523690 [Paraphoma chrysanthemicola]|uniref:Uncharacterized protein n=1 Tax=Paraphoma chrysanthemicola TaxID=798071 RepID=A0A8K0R8R0_9PLEO|nr:hypothetical protein FB567DRAFT_523690 [Paraphoma chrysanthemicola]
MHFSVPLLALAATSVLAQQPVPRAGTFVTWDCNECGRTQNCLRHEYQSVDGNVCAPLVTPNPASITNNYLKDGCTLQLHGDSACTDAGPSFPFDNLCKPIEFQYNNYYKITCV